MLASTYKTLSEKGYVPESPVAQRDINAFNGVLDSARNYVAEKTESLMDKGKNALGDVIASVGKVVDKYAPSMIAGMATAQFKGTQGSFQSYNVPARLTFRYLAVTPSRGAEIGFPTHRYIQLSELTGFVLCENARVPLAAFLSEQTAVEEFLNSGVYIE